RPGVVEALGNPLLAAQLGNAVFATKAIQHDPDLVFRGKVPPCRPTDVFDHMLGGAFAASQLRIHVRSFVLDENRTLLKSHPQFCAIGADPGHSITMPAFAPALSAWGRDWIGGFRRRGADNEPAIDNSPDD